MNRFLKSHRLRAKADIDFIFAKPGRLVTRDFMLLYRYNSVQNARIGVMIAKKKIPKAHDRNRFKRIVRETFRTRNNLPNVDIIFLAKQGLADVTNSTLRNNLEMEFSKLC